MDAHLFAGKLLREHEPRDVSSRTNQAVLEVDRVKQKVRIPEQIRDVGKRQTSSPVRDEIPLQKIVHGGVLQGCCGAQIEDVVVKVRIGKVFVFQGESVSNLESSIGQSEKRRQIHPVPQLGFEHETCGVVRDESPDRQPLEGRKVD